MCSMTDPYQVIHNRDPFKQRMLQKCARSVRRKVLTAIRDRSSLNVRILTRSPLAREDFDLMKSFGDRLLLGTSLPTLDQTIANLYEPKAPAPKQKLKLLLDAHAAGIPTYVAVAPVYPEVGYQGILEVFEAVKEAAPHTIFMEPVNLRLGVAERINAEATKLDRKIDMSPYLDSEVWAKYAIRTLHDAERAAEAAGFSDRLHLWPDHDALGSKHVVKTQPNPEAYVRWLEGWWKRISEWPGRQQSSHPSTP